MKDFFFWKVWSSSERRMTIAALAILVLAIAFFVFKIIDPLQNVIRWNVVSELSDISTIVDMLQLGQWQYGVAIPSHLVTESFMASVMEINLPTVHIFWIFALAGLTLILAALTTMSRFWYLAGMIAFILFLAVARLETLSVLGDGSRALFLTAVVLYVGVTYYFHAFRPDLGIVYRIVGIGAVAALLVVMVTFLSDAPVPSLTAATYSFPLWMFVTVIFLLVSSTEIMAGMVWLSSSGSVVKGKSGLLNFIVISVLYLLLLLLLYLKNTRKIDWDITLISPVYLALGAAILGIWGFRRRADSTGSIIPFRSTGFWLYLGMFIIAISVSAFLAGTANDPALETLEDVVVQGQLAMGVLFFFYVLVNFFPLFQQKLAVYKVLYKPMRFGLTQTRLFGFAGVVILFSIQKLLPVNQAIAGYFNGLGDLHMTTEEFALAEQYYKLALQQEFQNHKSNYALASLALKQGDRNAAAYYFRRALLKNPSPQAYAGLSGILSQENLFFDAVYSLQEGIRTFPESGELLNNLGMLYSKTNVADSAYYYLERAEAKAKRPEIPATNILAILAKATDSGLLDSLTASQKKRPYLSWQANWLAIQNLRQDFSKEVFDAEAVPADSMLSVSGLAYLSNYATNQARQDVSPAALLAKLAIRNPMLAQDLSFAALYPEFYSGDKLKAIETLSAWSAEDGERNNLYNKVLGNWLLQLGLYDKATEPLSVVEGAEGTIGMAVANALSDKKEIAAILLDKLRENESNGLADQLKQALFSGIKPNSIADSLLQVAKSSPNDLSFDKAVHANPFKSNVVFEAAEYFRKKKQTPKAYKIVVDALRYNEFAPEIWEQYAYLSLEQGLVGQGDEGQAKVRQYAAPADYQRFLTRYQPMRALIEKQRAEFQ
jgi:predicted Zn-dependent protease